MLSSHHANSIFPDGLWKAWPQQFKSHGILIALGITAALCVKAKLGGILAAWPFFTHRYDFIKYNFQKTRQNMFSFNILDHTVMAVRGVDARRAFYDDKGFSFNQGYIILMGGAPRIDDIDVSNDGDDSALFVRRLSILLRKERLSDMIPVLLNDIHCRMTAWGEEGTIDPFNKVYDLVFQMTIRLASCSELASDLPALTKFQKHYSILEKSATPTALLFPWFPGPAKRAKEASTKALFETLWYYIEARKKASVSRSDAIDLMLGEGMSNEDIVQFVLAVIFAGVVNTGTNACWILLYISMHAHWKSTIRAEIHALLTQHTNPSEPLHKRVSAIPISAWEDATPALELALRETIRLIVNFTALRRHHSGGNGGTLKMPGGDGEVPNGGFIAYCMTDAHMNPDIYTDPGVFDPERYSPGREEDKHEPYAYLGWGAGRHPCVGMKAAKLEIKMIVAMFVVGYEYDVVDSEGRISDRLPVPNYNEQQQARPKGEPYFIKFKRLVG